MDDFQWPEVTNEQLIELLKMTRGINPIEHLRNAIALDRRLLAEVDLKVALPAWRDTYRNHGMAFGAWVLTRGGTVEPLPPPVPTLAEALEATQFLAGEAAGIVIRYLQQQQQRQQEQEEPLAPPAPRKPQPGESWLARGGRIAIVRANEHDIRFCTDYPIASDINGYHAHFADGRSCIGIEEYDLIQFVAGEAAQEEQE